MEQYTLFLGTTCGYHYFVKKLSLCDMLTMLAAYAQNKYGDLHYS